MATSTFQGWSEAALDFYRGIEAENNKAFWTANKHIYETEVRAPFDALSDLVAEEFGPLKVFRPYRDVRFSKDKTPYKTRCYAATEGEGGESYYVAFSAQGLDVATGYWMMASDQLARYREAVDDPESGTALETALARVQGEKLRIEGDALKTAPRGYPRDHPRVDLLRRKSVAAMTSFAPASWLHTPAAARRITEVWRAGRPMNDWLARHVGPSTEPPEVR